MGRESKYAVSELLLVAAFDDQYNTPTLFWALAKLLNAEHSRRAATATDPVPNSTELPFGQLAIGKVEETLAFYIPGTQILIHDHLQQERIGEILQRSTLVEDTARRLGAGFVAHTYCRGHTVTTEVLPLPSGIFFRKNTQQFFEHIIGLGTALP